MTELLHAIPNEQTEKHHDEPNYGLRRGMALSGVALSLIGGFAGYKTSEQIVDRIVTPIEYSSDTTTYTVQQNEGLDAITSNVAGIAGVDFSLVKEHVRTMPENIESLADGIQLHETFVIPAEVKKR